MSEEVRQGRRRGTERGGGRDLPAGFSIGSVRVSPPLVLAPMAGVTTPVLRGLIAGYGGCGLYVSEMISARRVSQETPRRSPHLRRSTLERPFMYQIFGNDPGELAGAAARLMEMVDDEGAPPAGIDLNMGCSAPFIRARGAGAALLRAPDTARGIVAACREAVRGILTVKLRSGERDDPEGLIRFGRGLVDEGVDAITLHPRLTTEKFKRPAGWERIKELKAAVSVPVIGNGDIRSVEDVRRRFQGTGCDGIMIGRLAAARPWFFREAADDTFAPPPPSLVFEAFLVGLSRHYRPEHRHRHLRLFVRYFARNFRFGHLLESAVNGAPGLEAAVEGARRFFRKNEEEAAVPRPGLIGYW